MKKICICHIEYLMIMYALLVAKKKMVIQVKCSIETFTFKIVKVDWK